MNYYKKKLNMIKKINLTHEGNNAYILTITTDDGSEQGFWDVALTKDELLELAEFINYKFVKKYIRNRSKDINIKK